MAGEAFSIVYELGADQLGYFTAAQARAAGVHPMALVMMQKRNAIERISHGLYRLQRFPLDPMGEYMEAALWPRGAMGVVSHESALALYGVSDVNPARVHVTVPPAHRVRRAIPQHLSIHHAELPESDRTFHEGIPVTTIARTIRDCRAASSGRETLLRALADAQRKGLLLPHEAAILEEELEVERA